MTTPRPPPIPSDPYIHVDFLGRVVSVLVDDALGLLQELVLGFLLPPVAEVAFLVELAALKQIK